MEQTTESKHPIGIQAFGGLRRGKQMLALIWIVLFMLFQSGVGIHVRNCGHCCSQEKAVCHTHHETSAHHSHKECQNCPSCFKFLKLSECFPSEKTWHATPVSISSGQTERPYVCRKQLLPVAMTIPAGEKGDPPARAGSSRFIHFCHQNTLYA